MTNREIYKNVLTLIDGEGEVNVLELRAAVLDAIAKLDHTNEVRKVKNAEKAAAEGARPQRPVRGPVRGAEDRYRVVRRCCARVRSEARFHPVPDAPVRGERFLREGRREGARQGYSARLRARLIP